MKTKFAIIVFLLIGIGLSCQTNEGKYLSAQEIEIYKTLLNEKSKELVVIDESRVGVFGEISTGGLKEILKGLRNDTFESLAKTNTKQTEIDEKARSSFDYPLVTKKDLEKEKLKPDGYYVFSRVGFSNDGKQAVVMFIDLRSSLGMKGAYFLLENENGIWKIIQESESWKS